MATIHRLDATTHGECHGARMTANVMESFLRLVQKKDRPYFKAILDYIRMNTLQWVQDEGYSDDFMFRNHQRKGLRLISVDAHIAGFNRPTAGRAGAETAEAKDANLLQEATR